MGGVGSGRKDKTTEVLNKLNKIAVIPNQNTGNFILPNHSGDNSAGIVNKTPVNDNDISNKEYVDDEISTLADYVNDEISDTRDLIHWERTGTTLSTKTANDDISLTGNFNLTGTDTSGTCFYVKGGTGADSTAGQDIEIIGGQGGAAIFGAVGGDVTISAGKGGTSSGTGGDLNLVGGDAGAGIANGNGGDVNITAGTKANAGNDGVINLNDNTNIVSSNLAITAGNQFFDGNNTGLFFNRSFTTGIYASSEDLVFRANGSSNLMTLGAGADLFFTGSGAGLIYGEIYAYDTNTTHTISGTGVANKVQVTAFNTDGLSNGTTPDHTNDHITITKAGRYKVDISAVIESASGTGFLMGMGCFKNNGATQFTNLHVHRNLAGGGGDTGSISMTGIISLAVNDTLEVWIWNETNTTNIIVDDITMNVTQVGGA